MSRSPTWMQFVCSSVFSMSSKLFTKISSEPSGSLTDTEVGSSFRQSLTTSLISSITAFCSWKQDKNRCIEKPIQNYQIPIHTHFRNIAKQTLRLSFRNFIKTLETYPATNDLFLCDLIIFHNMWNNDTVFNGKMKYLLLFKSRKCTTSISEIRQFFWCCCYIIKTFF